MVWVSVGVGGTESTSASVKGGRDGGDGGHDDEEVIGGIEDDHEECFTKTEAEFQKLVRAQEATARTEGGQLTIEGVENQTFVTQSGSQNSGAPYIVPARLQVTVSEKCCKNRCLPLSARILLIPCSTN
eukprot:2284973-Rhodomonas_salina.1